MHSSFLLSLCLSFLVANTAAVRTTTTVTKTITTKPARTCSPVTSVSTETDTSTTTDISTVTVTATATPPSATDLGCFQDCENETCDTEGRVLQGPEYNSDSLTHIQCYNFCSGQSYNYFGVENGNQCFCGNQMAFSTMNFTCDSSCSGAVTTGDYASEYCGGFKAIEVFELSYN